MTLRNARCNNKENSRNFKCTRCFNSHSEASVHDHKTFKTDTQKYIHTSPLKNRTWCVRHCLKNVYLGVPSLNLSRITGYTARCSHALPQSFHNNAETTPRHTQQLSIYITLLLIINLLAPELLLLFFLF